MLQRIPRSERTLSPWQTAAVIHRPGLILITHADGRTQLAVTVGEPACADGVILNEVAHFGNVRFRDGVIGIQLRQWWPFSVPVELFRLLECADSPPLN